MICAHTPTAVPDVMNLPQNIMNKRTLLVLLFASVVLAGCRGSNDTDIIEPQFPLTDDPDNFALFLNPSPGVPQGGVPMGEIDNAMDFPEAYYNTIDPDNTRDSFVKWRMANGFLNEDGSEAVCADDNICEQTHVKFRDTKDLGYGRNMFMHWNKVTNDVAVYVENFQVNSVPGVPYGPLNFEALVNDDRQWNFGVNAIEFSAFPATGVNDRKFTKFYNFAGDGTQAMDVSGTQQHFVDLDTRGLKPMPTTCIVCHGGRGETLVYEAAPVAGERTLKVAPSLVGGIAGDVQAHMQTIEFDTLQFADEIGFRSEDNEDGIRLINEAILSTYEHRKDNFLGEGDWDATIAIETLQGRYAGNPSDSVNRYNAEFVPAGWSTDQDLYRTLMGPNCQVCHALRGTIVNDSAAFPSRTEFQNYAQRVDHLIYEQGQMPLGLLNYSNFWESDTKDPATMATALGLVSRVDANQKAIRPGAPVAVISAPPVATGIDAGGVTLDIAISGTGSAFATTGYRWSVTPESTASVTASSDPDRSGYAALQVTAAGIYTLTLTVDGVSGGSDSVSQEVNVLSAGDSDAPLPGADINFFGTDGINELLVGSCVGCHQPGGGFDSLPIHFKACQSDEFNGNEFLYRSVLARVNFDSPLDSIVLRKATNGSTDPTNREATEIAGYHRGRNSVREDADYSRILSWVLNGAPSGSIPAADTISADASSCTP